MLSNGRSGEARSKLDELADGLGDGVSLLGLFDLFCRIFCYLLKLNNLFSFGGKSIDVVEIKYPNYNSRIDPW
jgi:hypothetical protein